MKRKHQLLNEREKLVQEAGVVFEAAAKEERGLTEDERKRDDEIQARVDEIDAEVELLTRQEVREAEQKKLDEEEKANALKASGWKSEQSSGGVFEPSRDPETDRVPNVEVHDRREDAPFQTEGEFFQAVARVGIDPHSYDPRLRSYDLQATATGLGIDVPQDGGFLVGRQQDRQIRDRVYEVGNLLSRTERMTLDAGNDSIELLGIDETSRADGSRYGGIKSSWLDEGAQASGTKPKFRTIDLKTRRLAALVYVTNKLLRSASALAQWVNLRLPQELSFRAEDAIVNGNGVGKPQGFINSGAVITVAKETGQAASTVEFNNIKKMWARMYAPSRADSVWLIDQTIEPQLYGLSQEVGTGGAPVFLPGGNVAGSPFASLFGRPIIPIEYAAKLGTKGDLMLVDLSQYIFVDQGSIESASSLHVKFLEDEMTFRFTWHVDGQSFWDSALTPKSAGDTLSPYVVLAART